MNSFEQRIQDHCDGSLRAEAVTVIQANLGLRCNLSCRHCHVAATPLRNEVMPWPVMQEVLRVAAAFPGCLVDLTGGAPELNPEFRRFVTALRAAGHAVQVRTNLVVFDEAGQEDTPAFLAGQGVRLVASLPCYLDENVDRQRGSHSYRRSMQALQNLNVLGYGLRPELPLNLVYNPGGPFLPPEQTRLEADYRRELRQRAGVEFTRLLTITNMPLGRFLEELAAKDKVEEYCRLLAENFNPATINGLMCRHQLCVSWDGTLADCDFNLAMGLGMEKGLPRRIADLDPSLLTGRTIVTGEHCLGCTAGSGSSCGGALVA